MLIYVAELNIGFRCRNFF